MPRDERIDDLKALNAQQDSLADQIDAADVVEDAAYEATIADLQTQLATVTTERDAQEGRIAALDVLAADYERRLVALGV